MKSSISRSGGAAQVEVDDVRAFGAGARFRLRPDEFVSRNLRFLSSFAGRRSLDFCVTPRLCDAV
jgi:hypothetical protein